MAELHVIPEAESGFDYDSSEPLPVQAIPPEPGPASGLASLRRRAEQARAERFLDAAVPYEDDGPEIVVRYRPIELATLESIRKKRRRGQGGKRDDVALLICCDILATCCAGIYTRDDDGELQALDLAGSGSPATFTGQVEELGEELGVERPTAVRVIRALYPTDGDIVGLGDEVVRFSGYFSGEGAINPNS